jgi:hypothetical protein
LSVGVADRYVVRQVFDGDRTGRRSLRVGAQPVSDAALGPSAAASRPIGAKAASPSFKDQHQTALAGTLGDKP